MLLGRFCPISKAASVLGVPAPLLTELARENRIPHLTSGRRVLCDPREVKKKLDRLASQQCRTGKG